MHIDYENFVARMGSFEMDVDEIGQLEKDLEKNLDKINFEYMQNHPSYIKGQSIVKKYDMLKYDQLVKDNEDFVNEMN